jgi:hypothetical protein
MIETLLIGYEGEAKRVRTRAGIRLEVALRVFAARFNTGGRVDVEVAAEIAWEASKAFVQEMDRQGGQLAYTKVMVDD